LKLNFIVIVVALAFERVGSASHGAGVTRAVESVWNAVHGSGAVAAILRHGMLSLFTHNVVLLLPLIKVAVSD